LSHPEIEFRVGTAQAVPVEDVGAEIIIMHGLLPASHGKGVLERCLADLWRMPKSWVSKNVKLLGTAAKAIPPNLIAFCQSLTDGTCFSHVMSG
jgi:hypothetical protein